MENKNDKWFEDIMNDSQPVGNKVEDNEELKQENGVNKNQKVGGVDLLFESMLGNNDSVTKRLEVPTKTQSEGVHEVDILEAIFGEPDKYLNNASSGENENDNDTVEDAEEYIVEENIEGSENMEEPKVVDETFNGDEFTKEPKSSHVKNLKFRTGVIALALVIAGATGFVLVKSAPNRTVKKMNACEITTTNNQDNKNSLSKIEGCLRLSKAMKAYQEDNSYITNLDIGTIDVVDGKIVELTDNEYNDIVNLLNKLENATKEEKQTDNYKQMIKQFVGYSSKVNAYLVYYAPQLINKSILSELDDDGEEILKVKDEEFVVTYDYSANTILSNRTDGGIGAASYLLTTTGKVMDDLTDDLNKGTSSTTSIDSFVNDSTKTVLNMESTITKNSDGSLIVEYSKDTNEEIENRVNDAKLQMYRKLSQNNGKIRYGYFVPRDSVESSQSQEQASGYVKTRVKTM